MGKYREVVMTGGVYDANVDLSGSLVSIPVEHHMVHEGKYFTATDYDTDIDISAPKYWRITAPNTTTRIHCTIMVYVDAAGLVQFYENPTISTAGTSLTAYNNDRNSSTAPTATVFKDTTTSNDGTLLEQAYLGTSNNRTKIGGDSRQAVEFILEQNEDYIVKFTPAADDTQATIAVEWYEL